MKKLIIFVLILFSSVTAAVAETSFSANAKGSQAIPSNNSAGTGFGRVALNDAETEVYLVLNFSGLGSANTAVHLHGPAGVGEVGPVIFNFAPSNTTSGHISWTLQVTPQQAADLKAGRWYFDAHSANFPDGEIRGQIRIYAPFVAKLSGAQVVPPTNSANSGYGRIIINEAGTQISTTAVLNGINPGAAAVILFVGAGPGAEGTFVSQTASVAEDLLDVTPQQADLIRSGQAYFSVWTQNFPGLTGELRGQILPTRSSLPDIDGDRRADLSVFRPFNSVWYTRGSAGGYDYRQWGLASDVITPEDFDGDGRTDIAIWRPGAGGQAGFYILNSSNGTFRFMDFGQTGDVPRLVADYDGDGKADPAVYREGVGGGQSFFYHRGTRNNPGGSITFTPWGLTGDIPVRGDFNADGRNDFAVFRPSNSVWYFRAAGTGSTWAERFGLANDALVPADYDGDGQTDIAVFRPSNGLWYIKQSLSNTVRYQQFGISTDTPVPADYDGDGRADTAIWRVPPLVPGGATAVVMPAYFYILGSTSGFSVVNWGAGGDLPLAGFQVANPGNPVN